MTTSQSIVIYSGSKNFQNGSCSQKRIKKIESTILELNQIATEPNNMN